MPATPPRIGFVSLGCPKALVDSERILTRLRAEGYDVDSAEDGDSGLKRALEGGFDLILLDVAL
ncbi:MAG: hypothetical protein ACR2I8_04585, partial [Steroidobacteraceae bacterium]